MSHLVEFDSIETGFCRKAKQIKFRLEPVKEVKLESLTLD